MSEEEETTEPGPRSMEIGAEALRGLAHPLRARILDELSVQGPATATILGRRLGESSGSTSYHLRQLSRFGFVETDPGRSGGRDRWWRARPGGWNMRGTEFLRSPATREAAEIVLDGYYRGRQERAERWRRIAREHTDSPKVRRWSRAFQDSVSHLRLTPEETEEFAGEINALAREWARRYQGRTAEEHPETEAVELQTDLFPNLVDVPDPSERDEGPSGSHDDSHGQAGDPPR
ncbi:winged helix-turn-helix domain-containing protein [Nocardiopsis ganjiahuensis]|uniref:winged helix-turn-helix domain-containing protein n=1 Tax=Nocardiopsis ganjiahuensis TaxID=239984 RepID=UPI00034D80D2|nr:helix-turn-helix domain-containing protein [Nocardiopsis ganjiahuensis]